MIAGMLHNTKTDRYHPIFFRLAPMPSGADDSMGAWRHKSFGHHTNGFNTLSEAQNHLTAACASGEHQPCEMMWDWDGEDIPALVEWFPKSMLIPKVSEITTAKLRVSS